MKNSMSPKCGCNRRYLYVFALCINWMPIWATHSIAAPLTLQFEGTVGPRLGVAMPASVSAGEPVTGSFTFVPVDVPSSIANTSSTQAFPFSLQLGSIELQTANYYLQVDDGLSSDEAPTPEDRILLQCLGTGTSCGPNYVPGLATNEWSVTWTWNGAGDILDGADIPSSEESWALLRTGPLLVTFHNVNTGQGTGFQITVDDVRVVPEPISLTPLLMAFYFVSGVFVRRIRK